MSAQTGRVEVQNVTSDDVVDVTFHGAMVPALVRWLAQHGFMLIPLDVIQGQQDPDGIPGFMVMPTPETQAAMVAAVRETASETTS